MIESFNEPVRGLIFRNNVFITSAESYAPAVRVHRKNGQSPISDLVFVNNTCVGLNAAKHFVNFESCSNVSILNNIFYYSGNSGRGVETYWRLDNTVGIEMGYNIFFIKNNHYPDSALPPNDIWRKDPKFVNINDRDFRLQKDSPAIDTGKVLDIVPSDFNGNSRKKKAFMDIGAFAYD